MVEKRPEKNIKIFYRNKEIININNIYSVHMTKKEDTHNYLVEFEDNCSHFPIEFYVKNRTKIMKTLEKNYINLEDIICHKTD